MIEDQKNRVHDAIESYTDQMTASSAMAKQALKDGGIYLVNGELAPQYRDPQSKSQVESVKYPYSDEQFPQGGNWINWKPISKAPKNPEGQFIGPCLLLWNSDSPGMSTGQWAQVEGGMGEGDWHNDQGERFDPTIYKFTHFTLLSDINHPESSQPTQTSKYTPTSQGVSDALTDRCLYSGFHTMRINVDMKDMPPDTVVSLKDGRRKLREMTLSDYEKKLPKPDHGNWALIKLEKDAHDWYVTATWSRMAEID